MLIAQDTIAPRGKLYGYDVIYGFFLLDEDDNEGMTLAFMRDSQEEEIESKWFATAVYGYIPDRLFDGDVTNTEIIRYIESYLD